MVSPDLATDLDFPRFGFVEIGMVSPDFSRISGKDLSEQIFDVAKVPGDKRQEYWEAFNEYREGLK